MVLFPNWSQYTSMYYLKHKHPFKSDLETVRSNNFLIKIVPIKYLHLGILNY